MWFLEVLYSTCNYFVMHTHRDTLSCLYQIAIAGNLDAQVHAHGPKFTPFQIKNFPCKFPQLSYDEPCQLYALQVGSWPQKTQDTLLVDGVDTVFVDFKSNMLLQFLKCQFHEKACFLHLKLNKQIRWYVFRLQTDHQFSVSAINLICSVE